MRRLKFPQVLALTAILSGGVASYLACGENPVEAAPQPPQAMVYQGSHEVDQVVTTDPDGYTELVTVADRHSGLRAWAMEGSGGYGEQSNGKEFDKHIHVFF